MLALRFKKQEGCLKVILYEPNDTGRYRTFSLYDPDNACALEIKDFFDTWSDDFVHKLDSGVMISSDTQASFEQCVVKIFGDVDF